MELYNQNKKNPLTDSSADLTNNISTSDIISNMLLKYGLKETDEELFQKFFGDEKDGKGENSNGGTIFWIASKLFNEEKTEKDAVSILIERLHVPKEKVEQIIDDIKKDILPMLKEIKKENNTSVYSIPLPSKKTTDIQFKRKEGGEISSLNIAPPIVENSPIKEKNKQKQPDIYRESFE